MLYPYILFYIYRIADNLPAVFCYKVQPFAGAPIQTHCDRSFPIGCFVSKDGEPKDFCNVDVSINNIILNTMAVWFLASVAHSRRIDLYTIFWDCLHF